MLRTINPSTDDHIKGYCYIDQAMLDIKIQNAQYATIDWSHMHYEERAI